MVERRVCSFCGAEIEPGTGKLFVKKDGTVLSFDSNKCFKNMIELGRIPRRTHWTRAFMREKEIRTKAGAAVPAAPAKEAEPAPVEEKPAPVEEAPAAPEVEEKLAAEEAKAEKKPKAAKAKKAKKAEDKKE